MTNDLFGHLPPKPEKLSPDRARTQRNRLRIARGFHPFGLRLLEAADGRTCGDCAHLRRKETPSRRMHFKCALRGDTNGPGTDARKGWPACEKWAEDS